MLGLLERDSIAGALDGARWVINAIGITKPYVHDDDAAQVENAIRINSLFPYEVAACARASGADVIQIATDCVYSGQTGHYRETDQHDPWMSTGRRRAWERSCTRAPIAFAARSLGRNRNLIVFLIEWFRRQPTGAILNGFVNHQWNGVTTLHFARLCAGAIKSGLPMSRLQHVIPAGSISKYELLQVFADPL